MRSCKMKPGWRGPLAASSCPCHPAVCSHHLRPPSVSFPSACNTKRPAPAACVPMAAGTPATRLRVPSPAPHSRWEPQPRASETPPRLPACLAATILNQASMETPRGSHADTERVIRGKDFGVRRNSPTRPWRAAGSERRRRWAVQRRGPSRSPVPFLGPRGTVGGLSQPHHGADLKNGRWKGLGGPRPRAGRGLLLQPSLGNQSLGSRRRPGCCARRGQGAV